MDNIRVQWVTAESEAEAFAADAGEIASNVEVPKRWTPGPDEMDDYGDAMFEPLTMIVVIVGTGWLISRISSVIADHTRPGGYFIDFRGSGEAIVRPLPKADRGTVIIATAKEAVRIFTPDRRDEALGVLAKLGAANG
jgi:hypothetical protein